FVEQPFVLFFWQPPSGGCSFGDLCGRSMSVHGTFETCRRTLKRPAYRGRSEVIGARLERRDRPISDISAVEPKRRRDAARLLSEPTASGVMDQVSPPAKISFLMTA